MEHICADPSAEQTGRDMTVPDFFLKTGQNQHFFFLWLGHGHDFYGYCCSTKDHHLGNCSCSLAATVYFGHTFGVSNQFFTYKHIISILQYDTYFGPRQADLNLFDTLSPLLQWPMLWQITMIY